VLSHLETYARNDRDPGDGAAGSPPVVSANDTSTPPTLDVERGFATSPARDAEVASRSLVGAMVVALGYFVGSMLGLSLAFPGTEVSVVWLPNAVLLAALLIAPRRRWWQCLLAVAPAHFAAQALMGIPLRAELINFVGNTGDALLGAMMIGEVLARRQRRDRLEAVVAIMALGGVVAPAVMSFLVAELFAASGSSSDPWLNWRLRLLTNTLAVFTVVPPIVLEKWWPRWASAPRRRGEAVVLFAGLVVSGTLLFALPQASSSLLLLYLPLPFLLWAAVRFGLAGTCASVLTLAAISTWSVVQGRGPFTANDPVENATFFVLFLLVICAPLMLLGALIEERDSQETERRAVAGLHSAVLASMHDEIAVLDRHGVIVEVNESWTAAGHAGPGASYIRELERATEGSVDRSAERMLHGARSVLRGERAHFQTELPASDGEGWVEMSAEGLKRPEGGAIITHADVTARKLAEEETRRQRQELAHLTRVSMLGELSGSLAHELNQPLTAILTNAQAGQRLMGREPVDLGELRDILDDIADADRRAGEVIHRLRSMLKKGDTRRAPLALNDLVAEVLHFAHGDLITRKVTVATRLAPRLQRVLGDPVQLQQVLLNLVLNGCEAMSATPAAERQLAVVTALDGANTLKVAVVDSGSGIPSEAIDRIFEPFFTTKEQGLGLGLSICRSIVEAHGGRLWASNNEARGATVAFTLPALEDGDGNVDRMH
jgi:two-component system, LuxR family, sensor kinase FixL